jgi:hypothetical protein
MKGRSGFTQDEIRTLEQLITQRNVASTEKQKGIRRKMRDLGFFGWDDWNIRDCQISDLRQLISVGKINVIEKFNTPLSPEIETNDNSELLLDNLDNVNEGPLIERKIKSYEEKRELLSEILSGNLETNLYRVGFILNHYSEARNSDVELAWIYWKTFEKDLFNGYHITKNDLFKLTSINTLTRSRAKIQNEYLLFQADDLIKKRRHVLDDEKKKEAIEDKPKGLPLFSIYIDETGKTQQYLTVGSIWVVDGPSTLNCNMDLREWKKQNNINYEFHFAEVTDHKLQTFKEFFIRFLKLNPTIGFKSIIVNKQGNVINQAITDLTFHLINKGIKHENDTGRAPLPRHLQVWLDEEEAGSDQLKIENIKERLRGQHISGLYIGDFFAVESNSNFYIQAVDFFTSAINRKLHNLESNGKPKDILADYILGLLGFDIRQIDLSDSNADRSKIFNLAYIA